MSNKTGGPAFPMMHKWRADSYGAAANTGYEVEEYYAGMTLRDYFAAKAMQGALAGLSTRGEVLSYTELAGFSYEVADAMIAEREKNND